MKEMILDIKPFKSVGVLEFGQKRAVIRKIMESYDTVETFTRNEFSEGPTDAYYSSCLFLDYDKNDCLCSVEVCDLEVIYNKTILNILDLEGLKKISNKTLHTIDGTLFLDNLGVVIGHVFTDEVGAEHDEIESILITSKAEYAETIEVYKQF
jgi:hypothetical protein